MKQDDVFSRQEGNAWFRRNRDHLLDPKAIDWPLATLDMLGDKDGIRSVAELGCANGYRLNRIHSNISAKGRFVGVDASQEAISDGRKRYPHLELHTGTLEDLPISETFDLVIVNFVLHWVDRTTLARSVAEIDRLTMNGGFILLGDFLPDSPQRRRYHHYNETDIFTYKQDYSAIFTSLGTYREILRVTFDHDQAGSRIRPAPSASRGVCSILRKALDEYYVEVR